MFESVRSCLIDKLISGAEGERRGERWESLTESDRKLVAAGFEDL